MSSGLTLNLAALRKSRRIVGPGVRDVIWVQGCSIQCPGCANLAYQPHEPRVVLTVEQLVNHFTARRSVIDGVSVSGGEPSEQALAVGVLLRRLKALGLSTVVFSGRTYADLRQDPSCGLLLSSTDLLIDGPFVQSQSDPDLYWRGSRNQGFTRLSDRFQEADLAAPGIVCEMTLSTEAMVLCGSVDSHRGSTIRSVTPSNRFQLLR